jgi:uncharacterized protein
MIKEGDCFIFDTSARQYVYIANSSRINPIPPDLVKRSRGRERLQYNVNKIFCQNNGSKKKDQQFNPSVYPSSIALNIAHACNMSCRYCYADEGRFNAKSKLMPLITAKKAINMLLTESSPESDIAVVFIGGEPLVNREVVHAATEYAFKAARDRRRTVRYMITTNLTLLERRDVELFTKYPYSVTVSVDGSREVNNLNRRMRDGSSSYDRLIDALELFNRYGRPMRLMARISVAAGAEIKRLGYSIDHLVQLGFDEVRFSPVLVSPDPSTELSRKDLAGLLDEATDCGEKALEWLRRGRRYPFGNFHDAMRQLYYGLSRYHACSAGASYLSVDADGSLFACHRLIDDHNFVMGHIEQGTNDTLRARHLFQNQVDRLWPCKQCWARYLCGGGCYHEVSKRGRVACSYIQGWWAFCLRAYVEISKDAQGNLQPKKAESTLFAHCMNKRQ